MQTLDFNSLVILEDSFSNIKFFDKDHHYEIDGERVSKSVSQIISKYEKPFDTKNIAERVAKRENRHIDEVLNEWEWNKNYSCHKGSEFHLIVEQFFQRRSVPINRNSFIGFLKENGDIFNQNDRIKTYYNEIALFINNFKNFYDWWKEDHILLKSEFVIGDKETKLCGTIDNLSYNKKTNELVLFDYKTNKEIKKQGYKGETLLAPLNSIPKCELGKYSLQLWLYKLIIERNTPFKVGDSYIVWVAGKDNYELIPLLDVKAEAELILKNI